ncbi:MAG: lysophospholipid acyltransferase family protein [Planctomycetia bacterium]|nr:lysophospholipid acyltransferase family protein [Planctomycetia bacterium]
MAKRRSSGGLVRLTDILVYLVVRIAICVIQSLSIERGVAFARGLGWCCGQVLKIRHRTVTENLQTAFPDSSAEWRRQVECQSWRHLFTMVVEIAHAPRLIHDATWRNHVALSNQEMRETVRRLLSDRPVLIVTGHLGNFELGGVMLGMLGFPSYTIARKIDNPYLDRFVNRFRGSTGQYILAKNGQFDRIMAVVDAGGTLSFLADHHAGPHGCKVHYFGRRASAHKVIAIFSMEHRAPIVVCGTVRQETASGHPIPMKFRMCVEAIHEPEERTDTVRGVTQWYTDQIESMVRRYPTQYWWLHRRWRDEGGPRPVVAKENPEGKRSGKNSTETEGATDETRTVSGR